MDHRAVREVLQAVPFRPFRMRTVDGRVFDVYHRDFAAFGPAGRWLTHYAMGTGEQTILEPMLIVSIEFLPRPLPPVTNGAPPA